MCHAPPADLRSAVLADEEAVSSLACPQLLISSRPRCPSYNGSKNKNKGGAHLPPAQPGGLSGNLRLPELCWVPPAGGRTCDPSPPEATADESGLYKLHRVCVTALLSALRTSSAAAVEVSTDDPRTRSGSAIPGPGPAARTARLSEFRAPRQPGGAGCAGGGAVAGKGPAGGGWR